LALDAYNSGLDGDDMQLSIYQLTCDFLWQLRWELIALATECEDDVDGVVAYHMRLCGLVLTELNYN